MGHQPEKLTAMDQMRTIFSHKGKAIINYTSKPMVSSGHILVRTLYSGISNGTERLMLSHHHEAPIALGYSACGVVEAIGEGVAHVQVGDRVACYGAPYVRHADYILVPKNLTVPVPAGVNMKEAAFVGLGAIAIHALRQAKLQFGESCIIVGLGILGQIMAQIADAAAYDTIVYDLQSDRCDLVEQLSNCRSAKSLPELEELIDRLTLSRGVDSVLLAANGSNTGLIDGALDWLRDKGRVVIVGDLDMEFSRGKMFKKEAEVLISRAGGPGRYDAQYEKCGMDYPIGLVRWTEGRNMEEYMRLLQQQRIQVAPLISQEVSVALISQVYEELFSPTNPALGTLITYQ
jgi:NADPH2:quinone reductase